MTCRPCFKTWNRECPSAVKSTGEPRMNNIDKSAATCLNCDARATGEFCSECGQQRITERLTVRSVLTGALGDLLNLEAAFPRTFVHLFRNPGGVSASYVAGKRTGYVAPARFCFVALATVILLRVATGATIPNLELSDELSAPGERAQYVGQQVRAFIEPKLNLFVFAALPVAGLGLTLLFGGFSRRPERREQNRNYAEIMVLLLFVVGEVYLLSIALLPLQIASPTGALPIRIGLQIIFFTWATRTFFATRGVKGVIQLTLANIIYFLSLVATILALSLPAVLSSL